MKQIRATLLLLLVLAFATPELWAQGKKDKKPKEKTDKKKPDKNAQRELKREMMEYYYDIEKYEHAREEMATAKRKSDSLTKISQELKAKETQNNEEMQKIQDERTKNQEMVRKLEEDLKASAEKREVPQEGTFFSIQIGAFNQGGSSSLHDLFKQNAVHLKVEDDPSGFKKYVVGGYTSYEQASAARKKFMQMGAKGAWIVAYKNGSRVPMTDVRSTPIPEEELKELEKIKKR